MESEQQPQPVKVKRVESGPPSSGVAAFWEKYGSRLLLGLTVIALLYALIQYRRGATLRATETASENLSLARQQLDRFRNRGPWAAPEQTIQEAASLEGAIVPVLESVAGDAEQSKLLGQAMVARGDLYWMLANLPDYPPAATQPSLQLPKTKVEYLTSAESAYKRAATQTQDPLSATVAKFGLAAVAENRGQWDEAKKTYDAITADDKTLESFKNMAKFRGEQLELLRNPLFISPATQPVALSTQPTTAPATTAPVTPAPMTAPTTAPTTQP